MKAVKVSIREFRADSAEFIASTSPVAVIHHCQTVGYFIPTKGQVEADTVAFKKASKLLDQMLSTHGVDVDTVVNDFKKVRKLKI